MHGDVNLHSSLAKHGFSADDVTDVFLTHLHFDHCGGAIERQGDQLIPAFKNATYWSNEDHWNWAIHPNDREKASFLKENIPAIIFEGKVSTVLLYSLVAELKNLLTADNLFSTSEISS